MIDLSMHLGRTIKHVRQQKGILGKEIAAAIDLTPSQLTKIENETQSISAELFIKILSYLNMSFDEFCYLSGENLFKARAQTRKYIKTIPTKKNKAAIKSIIHQVKNYSDKFNEPYFEHTYAILNARLKLEETDYNYDIARPLLSPIKKYLDNVETWFDYEVALFINSYYMFEYDVALAKGTETLYKIKNSYSPERYNELNNQLYFNLALYALDKRQTSQDALDFITRCTVNLTHTNIRMRLILRILQQIAYFQLDCCEYSEQTILKTLNGVELLELADLHDYLCSLLRKHGIILNNKKMHD